MAGGLTVTKRKYRRRAKKFPFKKRILSYKNVFPKRETHALNFSQPLVELDTCRLIELDANQEAFCDICANVSHEKVRSKYSCATCNVVCCPECYDFHHREQMSRSMRALRKNFPKDLRIFLSEDAELYTYTSNKNDSGFSEPRFFKRVIKCIPHDLDSILNNLKKHFNAKIEVNFSAENICIYFQDKQMEKFFDYNPDYLCIDITCEIVDLELSLYLFICEDSNGHCEIVSGCLLKTEEKNSISWLCDVFKKFNPCWPKVKVVLVDNNIQYTDVIKKSFPDASFCFSRFHCIQKFKNDLNKFDMGKTEKAAAFKIFESIFVASSEDEYYHLHKEFDKFSPSLISYFESKWHKKRDVWALSLKLGSKIFLNPMNKFLCQMQRRIKGSLITQTKLEKVLKTFFITLLLIRMEHYKDISSVFQTAKVTTNVKMPHHKYSKFLTNYGGKLVIQQLNSSADVRNIRKVSPGKYKIGSGTNPTCVTTTSCSCDFNTHLSLPCAHIFAIRKLLSLPLFWETLCAPRWTAKCYQFTFLSLHATFSDKYLRRVGEHMEEQNFKNFFEVAGQILNLLTQSSNEIASGRLAVLSQVLEAWKHNIRVNVKTTNGHNEKELQLDPNFSIDHLKNIYGVSADEHFDSDEFSSVRLYSENSADEILNCIKEQSSSPNKEN